MNEKLKPCPFCGKPAYKTKAPDIAKFTACSNRRCFLYKSDWIPKSTWQKRAIEDVLRAENKKLRIILNHLFEACMRADIEGDLSELISGEILDAAQKVLNEVTK